MTTLEDKADAQAQEAACADRAQTEADQLEAAQLEAIAFVGETLAPFFLQDPRTGNAAGSFDAMAALDVDAAAPIWPFVDPDAAREGLGLMVAGLRAGHDDDALVDEYRRLFIGPAAKPAPPWGSVYTDKECVVFGMSTLELRRWMRANGIGRNTNEHTPEDHIGLMLALMAHVARKKPDVLDEYLRDHLLTWSSHFLNELRQAARHPFYQGLAQLTNASLEGIREARALEVTYPKFYR